MSQPAPTTPVQDLYVQARRDTSLASISASIGWLGTMILSVKAIAAGADFVPLPYLRAACSTVVILLETVDKIKKNRDALKDLCASMVEIVFILREAILAHWEVAAAHFVGLCETFIAYLRVLKDGLEKLINSRQGIRGRFREILGATSIADQIERYKDRMNELRLNFMLMATLETNVNVAGIRENLSVSQNPPCFLEGIGRFRNLLLGDINLISETPMKSKIKIFTARIAGEPSIMTVAKYENDEDKWRRDLRLYSSLRHPNVWQLFGVSTAPILRALIFHDELIPLPIYRQYFRPTSDLAWACIEAMLFKQFLAAAEYHRWKTEEHPDGLQATICVKRQALQICLAMPDSGQEYDDVAELEQELADWHSPRFCPRNASTSTIRISTTNQSHADLTTRWIPHLEWEQFFGMLLPAVAAEVTPWGQHTNLFLGSVVTHRKNCDDPLTPVAYIPNSCDIKLSEWTLKGSLRCTPVIYDQKQLIERKRFTFPENSFKASEIPNDRRLLAAFIEVADADIPRINMSWLSQSNMLIAECQEGCRYGVIDTLGSMAFFEAEFDHLLYPQGTEQEAHLFVCPLTIRHQGLRVSIDFPQGDHFYWSLDSSGTTRLSEEESDRRGLPRLRFSFLRAANCWHEYHYKALRDFFMTKGFDPESSDVTRLLGFPLAEKELLGDREEES